MNDIDKLVGITAQHNEIIKRVSNGSLDPVAVKRALQDIIEGKLPPVTWDRPTWWRLPGQQLERARQLWPEAKLPRPPAIFTAQTKTEVLLLHVPDTFDSLWDKVAVLPGYTKYREDRVKADKRHLRLAPNKSEYTEPVWLAFDPEHGKGTPPSQLWGNPNLAASEVFSALIQFPDWPRAWHDGGSSPTLSGYQLKFSGTWWGVSYIRYISTSRRLELDIDPWAEHVDLRWASPSVREC